MFLGEGGWLDLLDLVGPYLPSPVVEVEASVPEVYEDGQGESDEVYSEEVAERYFRSLDLSEDLCDDLEVSDWPEGWQEERIWGDISPEHRRSLRRLLGR